MTPLRFQKILRWRNMTQPGDAVWTDAGRLCVILPGKRPLSQRRVSIMCHHRNSDVAGMIREKKCSGYIWNGSRDRPTLCPSIAAGGWHGFVRDGNLVPARAA